MTRDEFYKDEKRAKSRELDFGVWWRDHNRNWPQYRVTWVEATGEVISVKLGEPTDYQILGTIKTEEEVERRLKGWADVCGDEFSLEWVKQRVAV